MTFKDKIYNLAPSFIINIYSHLKRQQKRNQLIAQREKGDIISKDLLMSQLTEAGISKGDTLLVHSSMSKIGYLVEGPETLIDSLIQTIGENGNLLMPTSPNKGLQKEYAEATSTFDVTNSPSVLGSVTEHFRKLPTVLRSLHPTEPVSAYGPNASELTKDHLKASTPYGSNSPFYKITELQGKILLIGVTLTSCTSLHLLEDALDFPYPVYLDDLFEFEILDQDKNTILYKTKIHNPIYSRKRQCDELIPLFEQTGVLKRFLIGNAKCLLLDSKKMYGVMIQSFLEKGITMYTPYGI